MTISHNLLCRRDIWALGLVIVLTLAACSGAKSSPAEESPDLAPSIAPTATQGVTPTAIQTELPEVTTPMVEEPSKEDEVGPPAVRLELVATHPSSVELASGNVQLIEFFAFW